MKIKQAKKIITILLVVMLTVFCLISLMWTISFVKENPVQKDIEATADLTISNFSQLQAFANDVNNNSNTYEGKTIVLSDNIDCGGQSIIIGTNISTSGDYVGSTGKFFNGTFDGQGYTISNVYNTNEDVQGNNHGGIGFFYTPGKNSVIKNTKFKNFHYKEKSITLSNTLGSVGCIAFCNYGLIQNCVVENFKVTTDRYRSNVKVAALTGGSNYGSIKDCEVKGTFTLVSNDTNIIGNSDGAYVYLFVTLFNGVVENCVFNAEYKEEGEDTSMLTEDWSTTNFTNCKVSANDTSGLDCGETGGVYGTIWYYGGTNYNSGYPCLRLFLSWKTVNFSAGTGGSVSPTSIEIPSDSNPTATKSGATIAILGQTSTATASSGYQFSSWTTNSSTSYTANFERLSYTVTFNNATGVSSGDSITPSGTSYTIYHGEPITASHTSGPGPLTLKYTFKNTAGTSCSVTYTIPEKYDLINSNNPGTITGATTITPIVEIRTFDVMFKICEGAELGTGSTETFNKQTNTYTINNVEYGTKITFVKFETGVTFLLPVTLTPSQMTYKIDTENYVYKGTKLDFSSISDINLTTETQNIIITDTLSIEIKNNKLYNLTFKPATNTTLTTNTGEEITEAITMKVESGKGITTTYVSNILTYIINLDIITLTYTPDKFYRIEEYQNIEKITADCEVQPKATFYACIVTMGNIDSNIGTRTITGDSYGDSEDGIFAVEFDTTVNFTIDTTTGLFKYTYTFSSGEVVTYTITNEQYAMQYTLDSNGERTSISNGLNGTFNEDSYPFTVGTTTKNISPTFGLKQYAGELG